MFQIEYKFYSDLANYEDINSRKSIAINSYAVTKLDLKRFSWVVGLSSKKQKNVSLEVIEWKNSIIEAFLDCSKTKIEVKNLEFLETTEKISVSYFLGMIFAYAYMTKEYDVKHLFHLSNEEIHVGKLGNKSPDLWGYVDDVESFLVEAKGSMELTERFSELGNLKKANEQLEPVYAVKFHYKKTRKGKRFKTSKTYSFRGLKKMIVGTHPIKNNVLRQEVIDPEETGKVKIEINADKAIYYYYLNLLNFLVSQEDRIENFTYSNQDYIVVAIDKLGYKVGLLKDMYKILREYYKGDIHNKLEVFGLFNDIQNVNVLTLREEPITDEDISLGMDGIILINSVKSVGI